MNNVVRMRLFGLLFVYLFNFIVVGRADVVESNVQKAEEFFQKSVHTNNWAVLVCSSRFWFNYRYHTY